MSDKPLLALVTAIRANDTATALKLITATPQPAKAAFAAGATRQRPEDHYAGDTALHVAASVCATDIVRRLIAAGLASGHETAEVSSRCIWPPSAAVKALPAAGADVRLSNKNGSTPAMLATRTTGRGGSGSPEARAQQHEILRLLDQ